MRVEYIFVCEPGDREQASPESTVLKAGQGIVGDRNFGLQDYPGRNLTLVEAEEIERFAAEFGHPADFSRTRRNLVTRGVRLNDLVGKTFSVGNVSLRGVELCEPCAVMGEAFANDTLNKAEAVRWWVGHGGLRADVLSDGGISRGDALSLID